MFENRIDRAFKGLKGRAALITYVTAGDPDLETTESLVAALVEGGADLIELGLPFSDPMADGPAIQKASQRALASGTTIAGLFDLAKRISRRHEVPLAVMTYFNPVQRYGVERFSSDAAEAGLDGLIIPDLPLEEGSEVRRTIASRGLHPILFLAPTSTDDRIAATAREAGGFIYCVSLTGVTGARSVLSDRAADLVRRASRHTDVPLAVGFGVSTPEQAAKIGAIADGVIVGSAIVNIIERESCSPALAAQVSSFVKELRGALGPRSDEEPPSAPGEPTSSLT